MKRPVAFLLLCFLAAAAGCSFRNGVSPSGPPAEKAENIDFRYGAFASFGGATYIVETADTVFYLCGGTLWFSDKEYKDFMPLCARPDCSHASADCDAHIDSISGIWLYGGHIYYAVDNDPEKDVKSASLWRLRLDGSLHEELLRFEPIDFGFAPEYGNWQFTFYDNYVVPVYTAVRNATAGDRVTAGGRIDLDDIRLPEFGRIDDTGSDGESNKGLWLFEDGDLMYELCAAESSGGPDADYEYRLTVWDQRTDEYRLAAALSEQPAYLDGAFMVHDGAFYYRNYWDGVSQRIHRVDLETGSDEIVAERTPEEPPIAYFDWKYGTLSGFYRDPGSDPKRTVFYAYDTELEPLGSFTCEGLPEEVMELAVFLQTDSYLFAAPPDPATGGISVAFTVPTWYIDKSEIGTDALTWRRWAP